jgi:hypothetical protein
MNTTLTEFIIEDATFAWLETLCDTPLPKFISGAVRVGDAARFVGAVA